MMFFLLMIYAAAIVLLVYSLVSCPRNEREGHGSVSLPEASEDGSGTESVRDRDHRSATDGF